jgi:protein TonB
MRANAGTAVSLTVHVALAAAVVWKTADARPFQPSSPVVVVVSPPSTVATSARSPGLPGIDVPPVVPPIPSPPIVEVPSPGAPAAPLFDPRPAPRTSAAGRPGAGDGAVNVDLVEERPARLAGPLPVYPDLLRQAGLEGRVLLEAVVDTNGRVERGSITVISATHPSFVPPAERSVAATLFRPARIAGRAVRVRIRLPIEFTLRRGR